MEAALLILLFFFFFFLIIVTLPFLSSKSGQEYVKKIRKNSSFYTYRGAIEDISEENQALVQRLDRLEEQIEQIHKLVKELHQAAKRNGGGY